MLIFGRNNEAPCCLLCFGYEREVPFLEGGTAFQFACGRFLAQLAMGVFATRRLLSVLFAFAPLPHCCAPAILSCGRSGGLARSFQPCFCMKKPADPGLWAMPALVQLLLFIALEPRAVYRIILQYKSARDTVRCRIFPARRQSLLRRPFR